MQPVKRFAVEVWSSLARATLETLFQSPHEIRRYFETFLRSEHNHENLLFVQEVDRLLRDMTQREGLPQGPAQGSEQESAQPESEREKVEQWREERNRALAAEAQADMDRALSIFETFIRSGASQQVNLPHSLSTRPPATSDDAFHILWRGREEVLSMMALDWYVADMPALGRFFQFLSVLTHQSSAPFPALFPRLHVYPVSQLSAVPAVTLLLRNGAGYAPARLAAHSWRTGRRALGPIASVALALARPTPAAAAGILARASGIRYVFQGARALPTLRLARRSRVAELGCGRLGVRLLHGGLHCGRLSGPDLGRRGRGAGR
jgi:hypothetical protein